MPSGYQNFEYNPRAMTDFATPPQPLKPTYSLRSFPLAKIHYQRVIQYKTYGTKHHKIHWSKIVMKRSAVMVGGANNRLFCK
jgi:hypothetical protein